MDPEKNQDPAGIRTQDLLITSQTLLCTCNYCANAPLVGVHVPVMYVGGLSVFVAGLYTAERGGRPCTPVWLAFPYDPPIQS